MSDPPALNEPSPHRPVVVNAAGFLFLHFNDGNFQSLMRKSRPYRLELGYTRAMMGFLLFNPQPEHIAMIGLGGGSLPKHCYRQMRDTRITVIEIDPEVIALREQFRIPPDNARFTVHCMDGAEYVASQKDALDVIGVDGFSVQGQVPQLCSELFYTNCHAALRSNGVLVVNVLGVDTALDIYLERLRRIFGGAVAVVPSEDCDNNIVFAIKGNALGLPEDELKARAVALEAHHRLKFCRIVQQLELADRSGLDSAETRGA